MEIEIEHADGVTVCQPVGDLDAYTVPAFRERLTEAATKGNVIIDLSGVPFMDSAGLGALAGEYVAPEMRAETSWCRVTEARWCACCKPPVSTRSCRWWAAWTRPDCR